MPKNPGSPEASTQTRAGLGGDRVEHRRQVAADDQAARAAARPRAECRRPPTTRSARSAPARGSGRSPPSDADDARSALRHGPPPRSPSKSTMTTSTRQPRRRRGPRTRPGRARTAARAGAMAPWATHVSKKWRAVAVSVAAATTAGRRAASRGRRREQLAVDLGPVEVGHHHAGGQLGDLARHAHEHDVADAGGRGPAQGDAGEVARPPRSTLGRARGAGAWRRAPTGCRWPARPCARPGRRPRRSAG